MKTLAKIIILSAILLLFINTLFSQDNVKNYFDTRHELSFCISNLFQKNEDIQSVYYYPPYLSYYAVDMIYSPYIYIPNNLSNTDNYHLYGISYKYNFLDNRAALRFQTFFNYNSDNDETKYSYNNTNSTEYLDTRMKFGLGFEGHKNFKRTQLYYGVDFSFSYSKVTNTSTNTNEQRYYPNINDTAYTIITVVYTNTIDDRMSRYGINPLLGIKFFITPKLSMSTETQFVFEFYYEKFKQDNTCDHPTYSAINSKITNNDGFSSRFGPIGTLSISYHF